MSARKAPVAPVTDTVVVSRQYLEDLEGILGALLRSIRIANNMAVFKSGMIVSRARRVWMQANPSRRRSPPWTPFQDVQPLRPSDEQIAAVAKSLGKTEIEVRESFVSAWQSGDRLFANSRYQVHMRHCDDHFVHLSIKRIDQEPVHDWRDLQRIKDELVSPDCEGIEIYPAQERLVDTSNQYHLWVSTDPQFRFPFGFVDRLVTDAIADSHHQRPFEEQAS